MSGAVLTIVNARVDPAHEAELVTGFENLTATSLPDGLMRTELLRGQNGSWRIETLWRDRAALEAVRTGPEPPAATELFRRLGADHSHEVFVVESAHRPGAPDT
ncbi:MAG TPA: antibiotic biosynthesis monooxygenase [Nocardioidaceae bacterium]|nr:antibiotic biosynthesis monooxygenase [Nocardioidaceae bacterium]